MRTVAKLCIKDRMRLLPNQQGPNWRRTVATFGSNHLRPARAAISLRLRAITGAGKDRLIPTKTLFQQRQTIPKSKVRGVPPMHLQMKLAVPTIASESGFLRRHRS